MKEKWAEIEKKLIEKAWQDNQFRQELIKNPKKVIEGELGCALPANISIKVVEETADTFYFRLPVNPDQLSDQDLEKITGGMHQLPCPEACPDCPGFGQDPCPLNYCQH